MSAVPADRSSAAFHARWFAAVIEAPGSGSVCAVVESSIAGLSGFSGRPGAGRGTLIEIERLDLATLEAIAPAVRGSRPGEVGIFVHPDCAAVSQEAWPATLAHLGTLFGDLTPVAVYSEPKGKA